MFIGMIMKTIPRSIRAGVALILSIILTSVGLDALQQLVVPGGEDSGYITLKCVGGLVLGTIAIIVFYYFQATDGKVKSYSELETLNNYQQAEREKQKYKEIEITPAYDEKSSNNTQKSESDRLEKPN